MSNTARLNKLRPWVQALAFFLFLVATVYAVGVAKPWLPPDTLMRLDPLAALAAMLASRRWLVRFVPALVLLGATVILGRFWCGWLCPLGTLIDWFSPRKGRKEALLPDGWRKAKYGLLFVILFAAAWGNLSLMILDPLTIFMRSVTTLVLPALNWLVNQVELALYGVTWLRGGLNTVDAALRGTWVSYAQPYYSGLLLAGLLGFVLALNLLARRAWCRYLCPLGGLMALVSKISWLKRDVSEDYSM